MESPEQQNVNQQLLRMHQETGIELVATNDVHYTYKEDADPHDILLCLQTGKKLSDTDRMRYEGGQYYVKSEEEMARHFPICTGKHWRIPRRSQIAAMWKSNSALPSCRDLMCQMVILPGNT